MQYIILGATGNIGSYIYRRMRQDRLNVVGTCHQRRTCDDLIYYDILATNIGDILCNLQDDSITVVFCIAIAGIDACKENYSLAYKVNITETQNVIQRLVQQNVRVIWFSSEYVFDGASGRYTEDDLTNPINDYGRMKAILEKNIVQFFPHVCILRLSKPVYTDRVKQNIFWEWEKKENSVIRCIKGNYMSFVAVEDIYQAVLLSVKNSLEGIYNLSGDVIYSRKELAEKFFRIKRVEHYKIEEQDQKEFGFQERRPLNVSMRNEKFKKVTGYCFTPMDEVIEEYLCKNVKVKWEQS